MTLALKSVHGALPSIEFSYKNISTPVLGIDLPAFIQNHHRLTHGNRTKVTFFVRRAYSPHFALLRGLIDFTRGTRFTFNYNRVAGSFDTEVDNEDLHALIAFLKDVNELVNREFAFRSALRQVISFEKEYQKQRAKRYAGIFFPEGFTTRQHS